MTYAEKLKDPRWVAKRNEILERDNYCCQCCGEEGKPLQVHHLRYRGEPWEVPNEWLETLCEECHEKRTDFDDRSRMLPTKSAILLYTAWLPFYQGAHFPGYASDVDELRQRAMMYGVVA